MGWWSSKIKRNKKTKCFAISIWGGGGLGGRGQRGLWCMGQIFMGQNIEKIPREWR